LSSTPSPREAKLAHVIQDIGYNLGEWSPGTLLLVAAGWASMLYRIHAEERVLSRSTEWAGYALPACAGGLVIGRRSSPAHPAARSGVSRRDA
jgi:hypothetical protein